MALARLRRGEEGYSLLEIVTVLAVMAVLTAVSMPIILKKAVEEPQIDQVKSKLNEAITECLRIERVTSGTTANRIATLSSTRPRAFESGLPGNYTFAVERGQNMDKCAAVSVVDPSRRKPDFSFFIIGGSVVKESRTLNMEYSRDCQQWGTCLNSGIELSAMRACLIRKQTCDQNFESVLSNSSSGQLTLPVNRWRGSCAVNNVTAQCDLAAWARGGIAYASNPNSSCDTFKSLLRARSLSASGEVSASAAAGVCGSTATIIRFRNGRELSECEAAYETWIENGSLGQISVPTGYSCTRIKAACRSRNRLVLEGVTRC